MYENSKKIAEKIIEAEKAKTNKNVQFYLLTSKENLKYIISNELLYFLKISSVEKKNFLEANFISKPYGYFNEDKELIKIFPDSIREDFLDKEHYLEQLLITIYHEYNHKMYSDYIMSIPTLNLEKLISIVESQLISNSKTYKLYTNYFYTEILANYYSIIRTKEYLEYYPRIYKRLEKELNYEELSQEILLNNYDLEALIFHHQRLDNNKNYIIDLLKTLYGNNIHDFLNQSTWEKEEYEARYTIISSRLFLNNINIPSLNKNELKTVIEALEYSQNKNNNVQKENYKLRKDLNTIYNDKIDINDLQILNYSLQRKIKRNNLKNRYLSSQIDVMNFYINLKKAKNR